MNNTFIELWNAFNDIYFTESNHSYTDSIGTQYSSVTGFINRFVKEKDWKLIAEKSASKPANIAAGKTAAMLQEEWKKSGEYATTLGTEVHAVMEYLWQNKNYEGNYDKMKNFDGMIEDFEFRKKLCKKLYDSLKKIYIPVKNEFIVYDQDWKLCGTIDFLCWNKLKECYAILDWKTSKTFNRENKWEKLLEPFSQFDECNCNEYSIQLSTYKAILEKHCPNIKIGELVLIQIPKEGTKPEIHRCTDFSGRIIYYLDNMNKK